VDYEEQTIITGVKDGPHCPICLVPEGEREKLRRKHRFRTHASTQEQIKKQRDNPKLYPKNHPDWVHEFDNFAWGHHFVNIHECMMIDKLHQIYKGIVQYTLKWVQESFVETGGQAKRKRNEFFNQLQHDLTKRG
jgi:hypothetical protein